MSDPTRANKEEFTARIVQELRVTASNPAVVPCSKTRDIRTQSERMLQPESSCSADTFDATFARGSMGLLQPLQAQMHNVPMPKRCIGADAGDVEKCMIPAGR